MPANNSDRMVARYTDAVINDRYDTFSNNLVWFNPLIEREHYNPRHVPVIQVFADIWKDKVVITQRRPMVSGFYSRIIRKGRKHD